MLYVLTILLYLICVHDAWDAATNGEDSQLAGRGRMENNIRNLLCSFGMNAVVCIAIGLEGRGGAYLWSHRCRIVSVSCGSSLVN
jgi:hypothetical protein